MFSGPPTKKQCSAYVPAPTNSDYGMFFKQVPMVEGIDAMVSCMDRSRPRPQTTISSAALAAAHEKVNRMLENMRIPQKEPAVAFALAND